MYELKYENKASYLEVNARGELTAATDISIDAEIRSECEIRNMDSVLIDIRLMNSRLTGIQNHNAARTFKERMGERIQKIAIVDHQKYKEKSEMFQLTATNRDANVKFFVDKVDAEKWLLENRN